MTKNRKLFAAILLPALIGCVMDPVVAPMNKAMAATNVRVFFSHQSIGRHMMNREGTGDNDNNRDATVTLRSLLTDDATVHIEFWDQDYDSRTDDMLNGVGTNPGYTFGGGTFRGDGVSGDVHLEHLMVEPFDPGATGDAAAWRDSVGSKFDIVIIKPGYRQHDNSAAEWAALKDSLLGVADWWENNGTGWLVLATCSGLRYPSDDMHPVNDGFVIWDATPASQAQAKIDVANFRDFCLWAQNTWVCRNTKLRFIDLWWMTVAHTGDDSVKYFLRTDFDNPDNTDHMNTAGSDTIQAQFAGFINELAAEYVNQPAPIFRRRLTYVEY